MTNPTLVTTPFAENGDKNTIPQSVGAEPQNATQDEGFPEVTQTPISAGGIPPERKDFNGILNLYGQHIVHLNKGLPYEFDAAFATAIGGYPLHARIALSNGDIVRNTVANNTNDPNSNMTGWINQSSAAGISTSYGDSVQDELYKQQQGTQALRDSVTAGTLDTLLNSRTVGAIDLRKKKVVIPNGTFNKSTEWFRNRDIGVADSSVTEFEITGQSPNSTIIKWGTTGNGFHVAVDYAKRFYIGGMHLDNTDRGAGTSQGTSRNGQMWLRYAEDGHVDNVKFSGGDVLSYCLGYSKNITATNLKVDYQYRYPVGYSKSPLILGDFSEKCMMLGGYVRSVSPDGTKIYSGDLADNDQSNDSKWAFINLLGLPYATQSNSTACMWQEGQDEESNSHFFGMNYFGNGIGHGISELSFGTDLGCVVRDSQVRGIWNRNKYVGIGTHFYNVRGLNIGSQNPAIAAAIHVDSGKFTASIGQYFQNNLRDISEYTTAGFQEYNSIHSVADRISAGVFIDSAGSTASHLGISNGQMTESAVSNISSSRVRTVIQNEYVVGRLGQFGDAGNVAGTVIQASTFRATANTTAPLLTLHQVGKVWFNDCYFVSYVNGLVALTATGTARNAVFKNCVFNAVTFLADDLVNAKYIDCTFVNCVNAPDVSGLNFKCDSETRPSTIRTEVTLAAGGSYTFPSWAHEARGVYDVNVGGRGANLPVYKGYAHKSSAASAATIVNTLESTVGAIAVTWVANGYITITVTTAGTYSIKLG